MDPLWKTKSGSSKLSNWESTKCWAENDQEYHMELLFRMRQLRVEIAKLSQVIDRLCQEINRLSQENDEPEALVIEIKNFYSLAYIFLFFLVYKYIFLSFDY
ncbi:uncharacterized protein LOC120108106 [Phoenix dactylifera]|uniref:Uncharacterized protein LOC120108106 n=1 Tax=Phoenix dactylifera TaxID=42345 RepID=A0A8B9A2G7_PHODC|nr:uncharacterized protein LOC120108106 [Phoenix dactylifera]